MTIFSAWKYQTLHGFEMLEAQEDWLINITDTLGNYLHHHQSLHGDQAIRECLDLLHEGLQQAHHQEELVFAELGYQLDLLHQTAHQQLQLVVETLAERHAQGEAIGEHLLRQLQGWLLEHCGQFHTETMN